MAKSNKYCNYNGERYLTLSQYRSNIFMPYIKLPKKLKGARIINSIVMNGYKYRLLIKDCRITQMHRDVLDAIILNTYKAGEGKSGNHAILFSLRQVLKTLGHKKLFNQAWLQKELDEMQSSLFLISDKDNNRGITFSILTASGYSKEPNREVDGGFTVADGKNYYYFIEFNPYYLKFLDIDTAIFLKNREILEKIINLKGGAAKALVRYCLSQNKLNKDLEEVLMELKILNNDISRREKNIIIKQIKDIKENLKQEFGIRIKQMKSNGRLGVFYSKKDVWFKKSEMEMPRLEVDNGAGNDLIRQNDNRETI